MVINRGAPVGAAMNISVIPPNVSHAFHPRHPEAFLEAFANIYIEVARAIEAELKGEPVPADCDFPTVDDGVEGMAFVETAVKAQEPAASGRTWSRSKKQSWMRRAEPQPLSNKDVEQS
jgi:hypothetical protein